MVATMCNQLERYYNPSDGRVLLFLKFLEHSGQGDGEDRKNEERTQWEKKREDRE